MDFYHLICQSCVFETLGYFMIDFYETKNALNEWNMNIIDCHMDFSKS